MKTTKHFTIIFVLFIIIWNSNSSFGQDPDEMRLREYVNPEEIVSIAPETPFSQAVQILSDFTQEFDNRIIIDKSGYTGSINVNISNMYWRRALQLIARVNNLLIEQDQEAFEIQSIAEVTEEDSGVVSPGGKTELSVNLGSREVEISAIFFEGNRRTMRELGIDWSAVSTDGRVSINNIGAAQVSDNIFTVGLDLSNGMIPNMDVLALFNALESANHGEILSSPRVKVMDGRMGMIQVGQDISIKQRDIAGNVIDAFVSTGTILTVTPLIISEGEYDFVYLTIQAERSSGSAEQVSTIINKQQAHSELLLLPGETAVIAGLYETEQSTVRRGIPFLKDLPGWFFGLKYIFGFNSKEIVQKELVIVLKANIVPSLQERADRHFRRMEDMLDKGRRDIILDREIGSEPEEPPADRIRSAPEIRINPVMIEDEPATPEPELDMETYPESAPNPNPQPRPELSEQSSALENNPENLLEEDIAQSPEQDSGSISSMKADQNRYGLHGKENEILPGAYTIVLYSLNNENRSRTENKNLEEQGFKATIWPVELPDGQRTWRTGVGQFLTEEEAQAAVTSLPESYRDNYFITQIE